MLGWILAYAFALLTGSGWIFIGCLGLAIFFPRLTRFLFATVAFPVWTGVISLWLFIGGWALSIIEFTTDAFFNCVTIAAIPAGIICLWASNNVATLARDD